LVMALLLPLKTTTRWSALRTTAIAPLPRPAELTEPTLQLHPRGAGELVRLARGVGGGPELVVRIEEERALDGRKRGRRGDEGREHAHEQSPEHPVPHGDPAGHYNAPVAL
jgi:hypothetical protein